MPRIPHNDSVAESMFTKNDTKGRLKDEEQEMESNTDTTDPAYQKSIQDEETKHFYLWDKRNEENA